MEGGKHIIQWLHMEYTADDSSSVQAEEIKEHLTEAFGHYDINNSNVGFYIKYAFPNVSKKSVRREENWTKFRLVYVGLKKSVSSLEKLNFDQIGNHVPNDFFVISKSISSIVIAKDTGLVRMGNRILIEVSITSDGYQNINICGRGIPHDDIGICNQIEFTVHSLNATFCVLRNIRLCTGLAMDKENCCPNSKCQIILPIQGKYTINCKMCRRDSIAVLKDKTNGPTENTTIITSKNSNVSHDLCCSQAHTEKTTMIETLKSIAPNISDSQLTFLKSQIENTNAINIHGRRWDPEIIQLCLAVWNRSPRAYEELSNSNALVLPSTRTLATYKNTVEQKPGINEDQLHWMFMEAQNRQLPPQGYHGGIIFDEMSIQEDLQIKSKTLFGLSEMGSEPNMFDKGEFQIANHVLQFIFHGLTGFRFLVAHYPTKQANSNQIFSIFWDIVNALHRWGFYVDYTCMDGASANRTFLKMNFSGSPLDHHMAAVKSVDRNPLFFLPDPSHIFKKIRNNILKSGTEKWHTRFLKKGNGSIAWPTWIKCYHWDKRHGLAIHQKLTHEHIYPNPSEKMRNCLAEEVLDKEMLNLMNQYVQYHPEEAKSPEFSGAIELLTHTSVFLEVFRDRRAIKEDSDPRLHQLSEVKDWFTSWQETADKRNLMSEPTREDILWLLSAFEKLCIHCLNSFQHQIVPAFINSDIIENIFSQQRGIHHGAGSNPNYLQYCYATNAITIGQSSLSKKSNAARRKASVEKGAMPYRHLCKKLRLWYVSILI